MTTDAVAAGMFVAATGSWALATLPGPQARALVALVALGTILLYEASHWEEQE